MAVITSISLDPETRQKLSELSRKVSASRSEVVRRLVTRATVADVTITVTRPDVVLPSSANGQDGQNVQQ